MSMKKKLLAAMLSVFTMTLSLFGCGTTNSDSTINNTPSLATDYANSDSGVIELKIWVEESNFDNVNKMVESFKKAYADQATFSITLEAQQDSQTRDKLLADVHNGADVFSMPDDQLYSMISGGALSPVINADKVRSENLEAATEAASYKGILYAYPYSADNGYFLYYDKNYFSEDDVKTLDEILQVANENGKKFSMEFESGWYLYTFFGQTGLKFGINSDGVTNYCNWNSTDNSVKGVDIAQSLLDIVSTPAFT